MLPKSYDDLRTKNTLKNSMLSFCKTGAISGNSSHVVYRKRNFGKQACLSLNASKPSESKFRVMGSIWSGC